MRPSANKRALGSHAQLLHHCDQFSFQFAIAHQVEVVRLGKKAHGLQQDWNPLYLSQAPDVEHNFWFSGSPNFVRAWRFGTGPKTSASAPFRTT
jgi:hypothetical protein